MCSSDLVCELGFVVLDKFILKRNLNFNVRFESGGPFRSNLNEISGREEEMKGVHLVVKQGFHVDQQLPIGLL